MNKPKAYILVGVPGSGKSTWVKNRPHFEKHAYISTDLHVEAYAASVGKTYTEVFNEYMPTAVELMTQDVIRARELEMDVIWDQTSTSVKSRVRKFNMLPDYYHIAVVFKTPDMVELDRRLKSRPGKEIPMSVVQGMISTLELPTEEEGFREIWYA